MRITKALYGGADVIHIVQSKIKNNSLNITANNILFGDPAPGVSKFLELTINGKDYIIAENQQFIFPNKSHKLGMFYTNNNKTASYCVRDLYKFKKLNAKYIDILSCSWNKLQNNPFVEIEAINKVPTHLSIVLQILQILYRAQNIKKYQYVAFLEHDVLYPEDYFEFDDFADGQSLVNMNYIGLCKSGFQHRNQDDRPLHQTIMKFDDAVEHFNKVMYLLLTNRFKALEPNNAIVRNCKNPSIHINNTNHLTSHYNIYSKSEIYTHHDYWGNSGDLWANIFNT